MKRFELKVETREGVGKKLAKSLRREGKVPAVIYGGKENTNLVVAEEELRKLVYTPEVYLVDLNVNGTVHECIVQELQFHPVSDRILHVDFLEVFPDKPIVVEIPVVLDGFPIGVRAGGKLSLDIRKLRVRGFYKDIPERLHINVSKLRLGKTIQVGQLSFENLELLNGKNAVVAAVRATRASRSAGITSDADFDEEEEEEGEGEEATTAEE